MKNKVIIFLIIIQHFAFGYKLLDSWLATPRSYTVYMTTEVAGLASGWELDLGTCINTVNSHGISNAPTLIVGQGSSETENCIIKYETVYTDTTNTTIDYGSIAVCNRDGFGEYDSFTITINDSVKNVTFGTGAGEVKINSVIIHELIHTFGLNDVTDPAALMNGEYTGIENLTNDEINGIKHVYEKPEITFISPHKLVGNVKAIYKTDFITFEVKTPELLAHNGITPPDIEPEGFITEPNNVCYDYTLNATALGNNTFRFQTSMTEFQGDNFIDDEQLQKFRTFLKRDNFVYNDYNDENSPDSTITFKVIPYVNVIRNGMKADYYTNENIHIFEATCTEENGNDYPFTDNVKFYFKKEGESNYTEIFEQPAKTTTTYSRVWDSEEYIGEVLIKATAFYYSNASCTQKLDWSDSITVDIRDNSCKITEPKDYTVEAINFELYMGIKGKSYTDGSVDLSTGIPTYEITDVVNGTIDRTIDYEYTWPLLRLTNLYDDVVGDDNFKKKSNDPTNINSMTAFQKEIKNEITSYKYNPKTLVEDTVIWYDQGSFLEGVYNYIYSGEDTTFDTKPGLYKISGHILDSKDKELVEPDEMLYIKPSWNLKLDGDYWYMYNDSTRRAGAPYVPKRVYSKEQNISMYAWRPFEDLTKNDINITITDENNSVVYNTVIPTNQYNTYSKEFDMYPSGSIIIGGLLSEPVEWERTGNEEPGFYTITATATDPYHGYDAIRKEEIQIPPLYITAETDGGGWPYTQWPTDDPDINYDSPWEPTLRDLFPNPATGERNIALTNDPNRDPNNPEDLWTYKELIHPGVTINKDHNVEFGIAIGIVKRDGVYQLYKGEYTIQISVDNGPWEIIKTVDIDDYREGMDEWDDAAYLLDFVIPLGSKVKKGSHVRFKSTMTAFPEYFRYYGPDYVFSPREVIRFDEIRIMYSKKVNLPNPEDLTVTQSVNKYGNNVVLSWNRPILTDGSYQLHEYKVYRDGKCIGEAPKGVFSFTDYDIIGGTTYQYAVAAYYGDDGESPFLDCWTTFTTQSINFPSPINFNLTEGTGGDDDCVYLEWDCASEDVDHFDIYRNDILYSQTSLTEFDDLWLDDGNYTYKIKAIYITPTTGESQFSVSLNAIIKSITLPIVEGFENGGNIPEGWDQDDSGEVFEFVTTNHEGSLPYEGDYFAYIYKIGKLPSQTIGAASDNLTTPIYDLSDYKDVTLTYKYLIQSDSIYNHSSHLIIRTNNLDVIWVYRDIYNDYDLSGYNTEWQSNTVPIPDYLLTDTLQISYIVYLANRDNKEWQQFSLDNIVISGTPKLTPPSNISVARDSTSTTLTWDAVTDATSYFVYRSTKPDIGYQEIGNTATTAFIDMEADLEDGVYFYKIVSESAAKKILPKNSNPTNNMEVK